MPFCTPASDHGQTSRRRPLPPGRGAARDQRLRCGSARRLRSRGRAGGRGRRLGARPGCGRACGGLVAGWATTAEPAEAAAYNITETPGQLYDAKPLCTPINEDCRATRSCCQTSAACYQKDVGWAECRQSCKPGVHPEDGRYTSHPTRWSCRQLDSKVRLWEVQGTSGAAIFPSQTPGSEQIGWKPRGSLMQGVQDGDWLALNGQAGFARVWDGEAELLRHARAPSSRTAPPSAAPADSAHAKRLRSPSSSGTSAGAARPSGAAGGPPIEMYEFKRYLFTAYSSNEEAFSALGSGDDMTPLRLQEFVRGAALLGLPLSRQQAAFAFGALDADRSGSLTFAEFSSGLQSEHFPHSAWSASDLSGSQPGASRRRPDDELAQLPKGAGAREVGAAPSAQATRERLADTPQAEIRGTDTNSNSSAVASPKSRPSAGSLLLGTPVIVIVNGLLSCLMVPFVCYVGFRLCTAAKEKSLQRRRYSTLGDQRALASEAPLSEARFAGRRRQSPGADSGQYGYELHPGVPEAAAEVEAREFRLSPRERRGGPSAAAAGAPAPEGGKKRRVISL